MPLLRLSPTRRAFAARRTRLAWCRSLTHGSFCAEAPLHRRRHAGDEAHLLAGGLTRRSSGRIRRARDRSSKPIEAAPTCGSSDSTAATIEPRVVTTHPAADHSPIWSQRRPRSLYFLSSRSGSSQIWRLRLSGGEPQTDHRPAPRRRQPGALTGRSASRLHRSRSFPTATVSAAPTDRLEKRAGLQGDRQ